MKQNDINAIAKVHRRAFGPDEGPETAQLAKDFLSHPDTISISVERDAQIAGNVLFTRFVFAEHPDASCCLLAPFGVLPAYQGQGVGRDLMHAALDHLRSVGTDAVFVLGVPAFYPRFGFAPTDVQTPYPDLLTIPQAWMACDLTDGSLDNLSGPTLAIPQFMQPHWWDTTGRG